MYDIVWNRPTTCWSRLRFYLRRRGVQLMHHGLFGCKDSASFIFWSIVLSFSAWYFFLGFALHEREFTRGYSPSNCIYMKPEKSELIYGNTVFTLLPII